MLTQKQLIEWAIKGLTAEIDGIEKTVNKGKQFLLQYERGQQPKIEKTPAEIRQIIQEKKAKIEELYEMKNTLKWELEVNDNESNN